MPAASTTMAQRWPAILNFNQYRMNGGLALPTGAAALFQKPLLLAGPYRGRGPGGPTPTPRPSPGRPHGGPPPAGCAPPENPAHVAERAALRPRGRGGCGPTPSKRGPGAPAIVLVASIVKPVSGPCRGDQLVRACRGAYAHGETCCLDEDRINVGADCPLASIVRESCDCIIGDARPEAIPFGRLCVVGDSLRRHAYTVIVEGIMSTGQSSAKPAGLSQLNLNAAGIDVGATSHFRSGVLPAGRSSRCRSLGPSRRTCTVWPIGWPSAACRPWSWSRRGCTGYRSSGQGLLIVEKAVESGG